MCAIRTGVYKGLYIVQKSTLYRVNRFSGKYTSLGSAWAETAAMCAIRNRLYVVQRSALYRADPSNGRYDKLMGSYRNTRVMASCLTP